MHALLPLAAFGGRLGPPSWDTVVIFAGVGAWGMWSSERRGLGHSTTVAVGVIASLLIAFELSKLL